MLIHNPQDVHRLRAQIAGWLAVEPNPHIAASIEVPSARGKQRGGEPDDDDELVEPAPVLAPADGLKTPAQAARRLNISIRTLRGLIASGELRYVNVGSRQAARKGHVHRL